MKQQPARAPARAGFDLARDSRRFCNRQVGGNFHAQARVHRLEAAVLNRASGKRAVELASAGAA